MTNSGQDIPLGIIDNDIYKDIIIVSSGMKNGRLSVTFRLLCYKTKSNIQDQYFNKHEIINMFLFQERPFDLKIFTSIL